MKTKRGTGVRKPTFPSVSLSIVPALHCLNAWNILSRLLQKKNNSYQSGMSDISVIAVNQSRNKNKKVISTMDLTDFTVNMRGDKLIGLKATQVKSLQAQGTSHPPKTNLALPLKFECPQNCCTFRNLKTPRAQRPLIRPNIT